MNKFLFVGKLKIFLLLFSVIYLFLIASDPVSAQLPTTQLPTTQSPITQPPTTAGDSNSSKVTRYKVPTTTQRKNILKQVLEIYGDQIRKAKTSKNITEVAHSLLKQAKQTAGDPKTRFVLYMESIKQYSRAANFSEMMNVLNLIIQEYDVESAAFQYDTLKDVSRYIPRARSRGFVEQLLHLASDASDDDQYDVALDYLRLAKIALRKAKIKSFNQQIASLTKQFRAQKKSRDLVLKAEKLLKTKPNDPGSNQRVGKYLCFVKNNWQRGIPMLAKGPASDLQKLAKLDASHPTTADVQTAVADAWYELAKADRSDDKISYYSRAAYWYQQAMPQLVNLNKARSQKRVKEIQNKIAALSLVRGSNRLSKTALEITLSNKVKIKFRLIPAGSVQLHPKKPQVVKISNSYYMGETEVTQAQWVAVMGKNPSAFLGSMNLPVVSVSRIDCLLFLKRLNESKLGKTYRFRLPSHAQWVHACRGGKKTAYFFGNDPKQLGKYAWYGQNSGEGNKPHPVGMKLPNSFGLYDTLGNVCEYCDKKKYVGGSAYSKVTSVSYYYEIQGSDTFSNQRIGFRILCEYK